MKQLFWIGTILVLGAGCGKMSITQVPNVKNDQPTVTAARVTRTQTNTVTPSPIKQEMSLCRFGERQTSSPEIPQNIILPIITYHQIANLPTNSSANVQSITVSPNEFKKQLSYLAINGYQTIYFSDLMDFMKKQCLLPTKPVILTFDDGWVEDYLIAFPELVANDMVGTFFPPTNWVDHDAKGVISWSQIQEMSLGGMEFGSHTESHSWLSQLPREEALNELGNSKALLEQYTGKPVIVVAYPGGSFNSSVIGLVEETGYLAAVTTIYGVEQNTGELFSLHRVGVHYTDTLEIFASRLK